MRMLQTGFSISEAVLVRVLQRNRTDRMCLHTSPPHMKRFVLRNWLMQRWRLKSPTVYCLQAEDPGKLGV